MFELGSIYWNGYYIPKNTEEALKLWRQSAEIGNSVALSALGTCYLRGEGLEQNYDEAFKCFVEADDKDMLGTCYLHGWGVKRDVNKTIELWSDFAESYHSHGMYETLWHLLIDGIEMEPDYERGFYWLNYAAYADEGDPEGGDYNARYELARCYYEGKGTRKDVKRALKLFRSTIELFYRYDGAASVSAEPDRIINARRILVKHGYKSEINKLKKAAGNGDAKAAEILREFEIDFDIPKPTPMVTVEVKEIPVAPEKTMRESPINIAVGDKVLHKTFGEGCVCESDDGYICVEFASVGQKKFLNPEAFNNEFLWREI
jgi:TPR repeat protein